MTKLTGSTPPFTGRQPLPPAFLPAILALPAGVRAQLVAYCEQTGEDPAALLADAVVLVLDELAGEVMDERELGFKDEPWAPQPGPPPGAPDPARGPQPSAPQAPPAQPGGAL